MATIIDDKLAIEDDDAGFAALDDALTNESADVLTNLADSPISDEADKPTIITGRESDDDFQEGVIEDKGPVSDPEAEAKAEFEKEQAELAAKNTENEAKKKVAQTPVESESERTRRIYLEGLEPKRRLELEIASRFPKMDLADVAAIAAKQIEESPTTEREEPTALEKLNASRDRLTEIQAALRDQDRRFVRVEEDGDPLNYDKLAIERDELLAEIPSLQLSVESEAAREDAVYEEFAKAEAEAIALLPDLANDESEAFAAVAGRTEQIVSMVKSGKNPPKAVIDGKDVVLDPNKPDFPYLVALEFHSKSQAGKKAPEAKPGAKEAVTLTPARSIAPAPVSSAAVATNKAPVEGQPIGTPSLVEQARRVKTEADLDAMLSSDKEQQWRPRRTSVL
jgi:hypothetical protein